MLYFGFDRVSGSNVYDDSGNRNNGELTSLATVAKTSGTCGNGMKLHGGESWCSYLEHVIYWAFTGDKGRRKKIKLKLRSNISSQTPGLTTSQNTLNV